MMMIIIIIIIIQHHHHRHHHSSYNPGCALLRPAPQNKKARGLQDYRARGLLLRLRFLSNSKVSVLPSENLCYSYYDSIIEVFCISPLYSFVSGGETAVDLDQPGQSNRWCSGPEIWLVLSITRYVAVFCGSVSPVRDLNFHGRSLQISMGFLCMCRAILPEPFFIVRRILY